MIDKVMKPLETGTRVKLKTRWRRGESGTVEERMDDSISGAARYGVRLDSTGCLADMCRFELKRIKCK